SHLSALETGLRAAKLKPVSFSLGISALQPPVPEGGVLAIAIGENQVSLEISCGGGVAALRTLEAALELEGGRKILHADLVGREARITLGQLPAELRDSVRSIRIFGPRDLAQQLADEMELRFESGGLKVEIVSRYSAADFGVQVPGERAVAPAFSLAANYLADRKPAFELLPPRVSPWQQMSNRYATGKLRKAGAVAGAIAAIIIAAFVFQQIQLVSLRSQWNGMSAQVKDLKGLEDRIKQFRPWYDENYRDLSILKALTQAFPEDGVVSAKTIEIRDLSTVTCTGTTRDQRELLKMLERLRADTNSIANLKIGPIRGAKPPMQFSFDFQWKEGPPK
ncbi:MAG TPA: hypothetical protein VLT36_13395, partial [Candidatus Dormibacteraeota bacterium]|nr:hypothetical protein [Candidatus Dormibacteraeota bacterium]